MWQNVLKSDVPLVANLTHFGPKQISLASPTDLQELQPVQEVVDVTAERFEWRVRGFLPHGGLATNHQTAGYSLQVAGHDHQTFDSFLDVDQAAAYDGQQSGERGGIYVTHSFPFSVSLNEQKTDLENPKFVPFGANQPQSEDKFDIPGKILNLRKIALWMSKNCQKLDI